jgi:hypothetical protein
MLSDRSIAQAYRIAFNMRYGRAAINSDADILRWHYRHDCLDPQERIDRVLHRMNKEKDAGASIDEVEQKLGRYENFDLQRS